ncbi:hypothetical protein M2165_000834 [Variovorax sp. TBS-050B]|uniref:hypothetical protein n=1 Tax=Variovorax sp. TBS-050B TaxID=2940551 RepID=UPI0024751954|nr:hypothetical protein [Variovorax sp. TBS-050B]MDH6590945.1 hypothetical protein [Variovorax sp. TBS-050B]
MKKFFVLAILGLASSLPAFAQRDYDAYERDRHYCASGRSGVDFNTCMWRVQREREERRQDRREQRAYEREQRAYEREQQRREYERRERWAAPPPPAYRQWDDGPRGEPPRLSDMQQRALDNCNLLAPRDQPRCRATVMSTVR